MRIRRLNQLEAKLEALEAQMPTPLVAWLKTLSDDDVDTLAEAAVAVKAGKPLPVDPATIERLEADYQAYKAG